MAPPRPGSRLARTGAADHIGAMSEPDAPDAAQPPADEPAAATESARRVEHVVAVKLARRAAVDPTRPPPVPLSKIVEIGGPPGPEPTRYGDWQFNGKVTDF